MKRFLLAVLVGSALLSGCGSSSDDDNDGGNEMLSSAHDGRYIVSIYNTEGDCITNGSQAVIQVEGGVLTDSYFGSSTVSGTVSNGNVLEGWMERNNDTVTFSGKFESTLTGTWRAEVGACGGYFEEYSREPLPEQ